MSLPVSFTFTVTTSNDSLYVIEREVLATPCDCLCCYDLSATVEGLASGTYFYRLEAGSCSEMNRT